MKKVFSILLAVLLLASMVLSMVSCGGGSSDPVDDTPDVIEDRIITVKILIPNEKTKYANGSSKNIYKEVARKFADAMNEKYPEYFNVRVNEMSVDSTFISAIKNGTLGDFAMIPAYTSGLAPILATDLTYMLSGSFIFSGRENFKKAMAGTFGTEYLFPEIKAAYKGIRPVGVAYEPSRFFLGGSGASFTSDYITANTIGLPGVAIWKQAVSLVMGAKEVKTASASSLSRYFGNGTFLISEASDVSFYSDKVYEVVTTKYTTDHFADFSYLVVYDGFETKLADQITKTGYTHIPMDAVNDLVSTFATYAAELEAAFAEVEAGWDAFIKDKGIAVETVDISAFVANAESVYSTSTVKLGTKEDILTGEKSDITFQTVWNSAAFQAILAAK